MTLRAHLAITLPILILLSACAAAQKPGEPPRAPVVSNTPESYAVPVFKLVKGTETQKKNALVIQLIAPRFTGAVETRTSCYQAKYIDFSWKRLYDVTTTQHINVSPAEPELGLKLTNKTDSVMTIAGATFALTVDGEQKLLDVWPKEAERKLLPDQPHTFAIRLPKLDKLNKVSSVSFAVYDLVSDVDGAGRISGKSRFEWAYQVAHETRSETVLYRSEQKYLHSREDFSQCTEGEGVATSPPVQAVPAPGRY